MRSLLLALLLCPTAVRAEQAFPTPETLESRIVGWRERKAADRRMQDEYNSHVQASRDFSAADKEQIRTILDKVWSLLQEVESKQAGALRVMENAVDQKAALGEMDSSTASNLKWRLGMIYTARMYYLYANMWTRVLDEGFGELKASPKGVLGDRFSIGITDPELKQLSDRYDFDPARYGLPKVPDTTVP